MEKVGKFLLLLLGCFLVLCAAVPVVLWGVFCALVNFFPQQADMVAIPSMVGLIGYNCLYAVELALGLFCVKKGLK